MVYEYALVYVRCRVTINGMRRGGRSGRACTVASRILELSTSPQLKNEFLAYTTAEDRITTFSRHRWMKGQLLRVLIDLQFPRGPSLFPENY